MLLQKWKKPEQTALAKKLSEESGFDLVVSYSYKLNNSDPTKYGFKQAVQDGKTALSIESGKLGFVQEENVSLIKKGAIVGYTTDEFGKVIEKHHATIDGMILYMLATPSINKGDTVMFISTFARK